MNSYNYREIFWNGFWRQNTGLAQLLGMCPILAVSTSFVNGVSLALATTLVMAVSNAAVSALRNLIPYEIRIPVFILIIAALVTVLDLAMNAWLHQLYVVLGIFVPLIVTNCIVLARVEAYAAKNPPLPSAVDGASMGIGLLLVLGILGSIREIIGTGAIFAGIEMIIPGAHAIHVLPEDYPGFLFAVLPPGAFLALACLIAGKNWLEARQAIARTQQGAGCAPATHSG
ncbi:electron transport complex subunit E [Uliginosibacterium paludis]|uniref:Ion-translocating oxidoreductase complex subunit E n=1 Tax=Uliginosibacterium paludis TaxID=1615952 RepID=A0ABV2CK10_9RHOO